MEHKGIPSGDGGPPEQIQFSIEQENVLETRKALIITALVSPQEADWRIQKLKEAVATRCLERWRGEDEIRKRMLVQPVERFVEEQRASFDREIRRAEQQREAWMNMLRAHVLPRLRAVNSYVDTCPDTQAKIGSLIKSCVTLRIVMLQECGGLEAEPTESFFRTAYTQIVEDVEDRGFATDVDFEKTDWPVFARVVERREQKKVVLEYMQLALIQSARDKFTSKPHRLKSEYALFYAKDWLKKQGKFFAEGDSLRALGVWGNFEKDFASLTIAFEKVLRTEQEAYKSRVYRTIQRAHFEAVGITTGYSWGNRFLKDSSLELINEFWNQHMIEIFNCKTRDAVVSFVQGHPDFQSHPERMKMMWDISEERIRTAHEQARAAVGYTGW